MKSHNGVDRQVVHMATALTRRGFKRAQNVARSAVVLFAVLFILLRPVCDALAASVDGHGVAVPQQVHMQMADGTAGGHADDKICCSSVDGHALAVPAIAPLPASSQGALAVPFSAVRHALTSVAKPSQITARRDPAPPLPYHARSLRRLD